MQKREWFPAKDSVTGKEFDAFSTRSKEELRSSESYILQSLNQNDEVVLRRLLREGEIEFSHFDKERNVKMYKPTGRSNVIQQLEITDRPRSNKRRR